MGSCSCGLYLPTKEEEKEEQQEDQRAQPQRAKPQSPPNPPVFVQVWILSRNITSVPKLQTLYSWSVSIPAHNLMGWGGLGLCPLVLFLLLFFFFFGGQIEPTATFFTLILIKLSAKLAESSLSTYRYGRVVRIPYPATRPHVCSCTELS